MLNIGDKLTYTIKGEPYELEVTNIDDGRSTCYITLSLNYQGNKPTYFSFLQIQCKVSDKVVHPAIYQQGQSKQVVCYDLYLLNPGDTIPVYLWLKAKTDNIKTVLLRELCQEDYFYMKQTQDQLQTRLLSEKNNALKDGLVMTGFGLSIPLPMLTDF